MLNEETIDFLVNVSPFEKLSDGELEVISEDIVLEYYPKGVKIHDAYLTAQLFQRFLHFLPPCGVHSVRDLVSVGKI